MLTQEDLAFLKQAEPIGFTVTPQNKTKVDHFVMRGYLAVTLKPKRTQAELPQNMAVLTAHGQQVLNMIKEHPGWANKASL